MTSINKITEMRFESSNIVFALDLFFFYPSLSLFLTRSVNICILLWDMMLGISPLLCTCQCLSTYLQPSLSCYLSIWHLTLSLLSLSLHSHPPSLCMSIHAYLFPFSLSFSPVVVIKRALCVSLQCCVIRVESEHKRERLCVWLVSQRPEEYAVPFWLGILKAQSHSCCLCVSSPWPHLHKPRPQSQLSNKPKIQCISIILSNGQGGDTTQSCAVSVFWGYLKLVMLSWDLSSAESLQMRLKYWNRKKSGILPWTVIYALLKFYGDMHKDNMK